MPTLLVIGALALDRPIRLDAPLRSGGRVRGRSLDGALEGRLGGGAANAGCALLAAGHAVLIASLLADDAEGRRVRAAAEAAGLDLSLTGVRRLDLSLTGVRPGASGRTLVFVEPSGERTIIGLDGSLPEGRPAIDPPSDHPGVRPDGLFIRSAFGGAADWAQLTAGPVILHWPTHGYDGEADVVVASADDLPEGQAAAPFADAAARLGPRLAWVVTTHGAAGAIAHGRDGTRIAAKVPPAVTRDATGAGDAFAAGLLEALAGGASMEQALPHACAWGAAAAGLDSSAPAGAAAGTFQPWSGEALAQLA
jgi:sugar/nucleoside kinase (ribokinase family)